MSNAREMPEDPTQNPEQALDAAEEKVLGATSDQVRDDENDELPPDDASSTPVADEPPA